MSLDLVVSWDVMTYRGVMPYRHRRSAAFRFGYALGATFARLVIFPVHALLHAGDSE